MTSVTWMGCRSVAAAGIVLLGLWAADAGAQDGRLYIGVEGGGAFLADADNTGPTGITIESDFDTGYNVGGVIGYRVWSNFRLEAEVNYKRNSLDTLTIVQDAGAGVALGVGDLDGFSIAADGDVTSISGMANAWYDIPLDSRLIPYLGGGIGIANVSASDVRVLGVTLVDDDDTGFAWQAGAGLAYGFDSGVTISLDYRFFSASDPSLNDATGTEFETEYDSHNLMLGLKYWF